MYRKYFEVYTSTVIKKNAQLIIISKINIQCVKYFIQNRFIATKRKLIDSEKD